MTEKSKDPVGTGPDHCVKFARNTTPASDLRVSVVGVLDDRN